MASSRTSGNGSPCVTARRGLAAPSSPRSTARRFHAPAREHLFEDAAVGGVVVDDERREAAREVGGRRSAGDAPRLGWRPKRGGEVERAAASGLALDPDPPAHQLDQARARSPGRGRCRRTGGWSSRRPARRGRRSACCFSAGMPMPVSVTVKWRQHAARQPLPRRADPAPRPRPRPRSVNLMALPTRLTSTCRSRSESPTSASGTSGAIRQASSRPFWCGAVAPAS